MTKVPFFLDKRPGPAYFNVDLGERLVAGFGLRTGGRSQGAFASANMSFAVGDQEAAVAANRRALLEKIGPDDFRTLYSCRQVHGCSSLLVDGQTRPEELAGIEADALLTATPGLLLGVLTADCLPLVMVSRQPLLAAVIHAGWRGLAQGIAGKVLKRMVDDFGATAATVEAYAGPAIGPCCFEVGTEVWRVFQGHPELAGQLDWFRRESDNFYLDLWLIQARQLQAAGLPAENFKALRHCSRCRDLSFSYRRDHGITGRQVTFAGLRPA